ncbi:hypothetical protein PsorP6_010981 [Peronosclerospora sorghi]|uniref:Uncharacterized protein n=1 Tax=Peronosclerospora sorghi TaxID=230839 RepID=A0ACC0VY22_9STRA|nr:hypothetical protein PsorP6_010981 [Peronosclerospora sorghi]
MSKLNPNAGEWVPTFSAPLPDASLPVDTEKPSRSVNRRSLEMKVEPDGPVAAMASNPVANTSARAVCDERVSPCQERFIYSKEYLLAFQPLGDHILPHLPTVVRNPTPPKPLGATIQGKRVYTVAELLQFQPLYDMMPNMFEWTHVLGTHAVDPIGSKKQHKKDKSRPQKSERAILPSSLVCYFNPTDYAAAIMAMGRMDPSHEPTPLDREAVHPLEEAISARRRVATLLEHIRAETMPHVLASLQSLPIHCHETLDELIGQLFDHAMAHPELSECYATLCTELSKHTPEFKQGAKTINFRRILLVKCYEALIEDDAATSSRHKGVVLPLPSLPSPSSSSRRNGMLQNVHLVGTLFRRQLLTENVMHVCMAMMLDDEFQPEPAIIQAACQLLTLVGDLLDGSSPASRRSMDEYFAVLGRMHDDCPLPDPVKQLIRDVRANRSCKWMAQESTRAVAKFERLVVASQALKQKHFFLGGGAFFLPSTRCYSRATSRN